MGTLEDANLLMLKGSISDLTDEQQALVKRYYDDFKDTLSRSESENDGCAQVAFALVGAEMAAED